MIMRLMVAALAAAAIGLPAAAAVAAQSTGQPDATKRCAQLEAQVASLLPDTIPSMLRQATSERAEGARLCAAGKTDQGIATLQRALSDALYRG